ncbi:ribosomal RNA small subunit methyltransferase A [Paenibacillus sp. 1P07SE]|uniref:ribosomal RNA small subunit methyltransferase A n=1 Tax=Paenibacillus sp. 1P07SE TaxID=3132209 RepID=UPI0039A614A9
MRNENKKHRKIRKCVPGPSFAGQHLLHHPGTIRELIRLPRLSPGETVVEIGAGKGAITLPLLETGCRIVAVERDPQMVDYLREKIGDGYPLVIKSIDFRKMRLPEGPFCVVANIPFAITTEILERLLGEGGKRFERGALIMELGAARRFTAAYPSDPRVLAWQMNYRMTVRKTVPRSHFSPPPKVDAALVSLERRGDPQLAAGQHQRFRAFAGYLLRHACEPLYEALRPVFTAEQIKRMMKQAGTDRDQSSARLSIRQWGILFSAMLQYVPSHRWPR